MLKNELLLDHQLEYIIKQPALLTKQFGGESLTGLEYKHVIEVQETLPTLITFVKYVQLKELHLIIA